MSWVMSLSWELWPMPELAPAGGGQVQLVKVVGEVAPVADRAAVVRRHPDLV